MHYAELWTVPMISVEPPQDALHDLPELSVLEDAFTPAPDSPSLALPVGAQVELEHLGLGPTPAVAHMELRCFISKL